MISEDLKDFDEDDEMIDLRKERLESLINQQPILLNNVRLRQNPHDVKQWLYRVKLFTDPSKGAVTEADPVKAVIAFTEGVKTVDPMKAVGKFSLLWIEFAKFMNSMMILRMLIMSLRKQFKYLLRLLKN